MPKAQAEVDEAILRRRERKRRNTQVWREKERNLLEGLRMQVANLEQQLAQTGHVNQKKVDLEAKLNELRQQQIELKHQNHLLEEALRRREAGILVSSSALGEPQPDGEPQLYDNVFLLNHIQQALREMSSIVPSTMDQQEKLLDMRLVNGWLAKSVQVDRHLYFDVSKTLQNASITSSSAQIVSQRHWTLLTQREPYMRINSKAIDFHVVRRPHDDLYVVRCAQQFVPNAPPAVRYMVLYKIQTTGGYDFCSMSFAPDLSCIVGSLMLKYRQATPTSTPTAVALGRCLVPEVYDYRQTMMVLVSQITQWEKLLVQQFSSK